MNAFVIVAGVSSQPTGKRKVEVYFWDKARFAFQNLLPVDLAQRQIG